ncbi:hypothetical protein [Hymenobacter sp. BT730]|uniref:hypothetical protein n=1 Tax=Hymenobacter sp. BT730 TaxID=3063332 RepID=UPI0026E10BE5|nr:hypothetical protein [Hymenobacter sp. BT730]
MSQSLDDLFELLRKAAAPVEIAAVQHAIWEVWLDSGDTALNKRLEEGMRALAAEEYTRAIAEFTYLIEQRPEWAEGWNKRATAHYLRGGYRASLLDIQETLRLEPRHFGALSGWAGMLQLLGDERGALRILQRLSRLCPQMPGLQARIRDLRDQLPEADL